jgi:hypothetical protein
MVCDWAVVWAPRDITAGGTVRLSAVATWSSLDLSEVRCNRLYHVVGQYLGPLALVDVDEHPLTVDVGEFTETDHIQIDRWRFIQEPVYVLRLTVRTLLFDASA